MKNVSVQICTESDFTEWQDLTQKILNVLTPFGLAQRGIRVSHLAKLEFDLMSGSTLAAFGPGHIDGQLITAVAFLRVRNVAEFRGVDDAPRFRILIMNGRAIRPVLKHFRLRKLHDIRWKTLKVSTNKNGDKAWPMGSKTYCIYFTLQNFGQLNAVKPRFDRQHCFLREPKVFSSL
jgi:hypothetical protein